MQFFTIDEAHIRLAHLLDPGGKPQRSYPEIPVARFSFREQHLSKVVSTVLGIVDAVGPWEEAWLWLDKPDTWNRELLPLYYRLRQSCNDHRLVTEAPVHFFHRHEHPDLVAFVMLAILNEWPAFLVTSHDYGRVFLSASHWMEVTRSDRPEYEAVRAVLAERGFQEVSIHP